MGNPYSGDLTLTGLVSTKAKVDFFGLAKAWVNGPCGSRRNLAKADVIGEGKFGADMSFKFDLKTGSIDAELTVTRADLNSKLDIDALG